MHRFAVQHQLFPLDPLPMDTGWANTFGTEQKCRIFHHDAQDLSLLTQRPGRGSTTAMMHVPKLRREQRTEVPELAAAATDGTRDTATSSQTFSMSRLRSLLPRRA